MLDLTARLGIPGVRAVVSTRGDGTLGFTGAPDPVAVGGRRRALLSDGGARHPEHAHGLHQVHGAQVVTVGEEHRGRGGLGTDPAPPRADALVTVAAETPLLALGADCVVAVVAAPDGAAVGVFHAGWRGTAAGVPERTAAAVAGLAGASPAALRIVLGPAIGPCCYEVGEEVVDSLAERRGAAAQDHCRPGPRGRPLLDLPGLVTAGLVSAGVSRRRLMRLDACTRCDTGPNGERRWWSHRAGESGRQVLAAWRSGG